MEIRYLTREEHKRSRILYEEVFIEDEQAFVDAYYEIKGADNEILVVEDEGNIVSMLHRNPYTFLFRDSSVRADYLVAVATKRTYRHQGLMRSLLTKALCDMAAEKMPFTFLMPADEAIYTPFDFCLMGNEDEASLSKLSREQLAEDYELFVKKDDDYRRRQIPWPEWETTPMMMRLVHLPSFVAKVGAEEEQSFILTVKDPIISQNNRTFLWKFGLDSSSLTPVEEEPDLCVSIKELGSFLCGMIGAEELSEIKCSKNSTEVIKKLEKIQVLNGIYINEVV
ncbi:MAG: GNAT family N-acetyltransferase [Lachnospiraceae bacterium]|nr:GNAT family N-acetyltransferase [Lachnospiraceae bacterium]